MSTKINMAESNILLSVCIPTYNRKKELLEVINTVLSIERDDIDVVVTDNCSTDGTGEELKKIKDMRLKYYKNEEPIPPMNNITTAIFNGDGNYIFYCNDRDLIVLPGFLALINLIEREEFAYIQTANKGETTEESGRQGFNSENVVVYRNGFESLMNLPHTLHPTGMVFNGKIMRKYLKKEDYFKYLKCTDEFAFIMRDMLMYEGGKSAKFDCACWDVRPLSWFMNNKSGSVSGGNMPDFYPEVQHFAVKDTLKQTLKINDYGMSEDEKIKVGIHVLRYFYGRLMFYKAYMSRTLDTKRYGLKRRFVSTPEMVWAFQKYFYQSMNYLMENEYQEELCREWKRQYVPLLCKMIYWNYLADWEIFLRWIMKKDPLAINLC